MTAYPDDFPDSFTIPPLPPTFDEWFDFVSGLHRAELVYDGAILDGLDVVDADSARRALEGYRFVNDGDGWVDTAERGGWNENWIVVESVNADPLIADLSTPEVRMLEARHGEVRWQPQVICDSLHEFISQLTVSENVPSPPLDAVVTFDWSVWLTSLGPEPKRTLVRLQTWPAFPRMSRAELLRVPERLPLLVVDGVTETVARNSAEWALSQGFPVEVRRRDGGTTGV